MKKLNVVYLAVVCFALFFSSCGLGDLGCIDGDGTIETRVIDFDEIEGFELEGGMNLTITEGNDQEISIRSYPNIIDDLELGSSVRNGILKLDYDSRCITLDEDVEVFATIAALRSIESSGSSKIRTDGIFNNVTDLDLESSGSSDVILRLGDDMRFVSIDISGSGDFELSGTTERQEIEISGSGDINNFNLITQRAKVEINGSGDCELLIEEELDIDISGSGDVCYRGTPTVDSDVSGSGRVRNCN